VHKRDVNFLVISFHLPGTKALVADNSICLLRIGEIDHEVGRTARSSRVCRETKPR
jgi:hypothetical protein